ncbi:MAG: hypothetical protein WBE68_19055 [Candidatus Nitrosopolaris sp.]
MLKPNKGLAEAGRSRHMIDFIYVNLSRALTRKLLSSVMTTNGIVIFQLEEFKAQLLLLWLREIEIRKHVPEPH